MCVPRRPHGGATHSSRPRGSKRHAPRKSLKTREVTSVGPSRRLEFTRLTFPHVQDSQADSQLSRGHPRAHHRLKVWLRPRGQHTLFFINSAERRPYNFVDFRGSPRCLFTGTMCTVVLPEIKFKSLYIVHSSIATVAFLFLNSQISIANCYVLKWFP